MCMNVHAIVVALLLYSGFPAGAMSAPSPCQVSTIGPLKDLEAVMV